MFARDSGNPARQDARTKPARRCGEVGCDVGGGGWQRRLAAVAAPSHEDGPVAGVEPSRLGAEFSPHGWRWAGRGAKYLQRVAGVDGVQ